MTEAVAGWRAQVRTELERPIDATCLAWFRLVVGLSISYHVVSMLLPTEHGPSRLEAFLIDPVFHAKYWGFGWVRPWSGLGMFVHYGALGALALALTLGFATRLAAAGVALLFAYAFLIDKALFLNHYYLLCQLAFLLALLPVSRRWSLDSWLGWSGAGPRAPAWALWALRVQLGLVYFWAAVAKCNPDWLAGLPARSFLEGAQEVPVLAGLAGEPAAVLFVAYAGLLIDLLAFPLLLWGPTRVPMTLVLAGFHLTNAALFDIGAFPWFMLASTVLFYPPEAVGRTGDRILDWLGQPPPDEDNGDATPQPRGSPLVVAIVGAHLFVQALLPLRQFLVRGNVDWHDHGYHWCWRMKTRTGDAAVRVYVFDLERLQVWGVPLWEHLRIFQYKEIARDPDQALQYVHWLAAQLRKHGHRRFRIRVVNYESINYRPPQLQISPEVDLARAERAGPLEVPTWVQPLDHPAPELTTTPPAPSEAVVSRLAPRSLFEGAYRKELARRKATGEPLGPLEVLPMPWNQAPPSTTQTRSRLREGATPGPPPRRPH